MGFSATKRELGRTVRLFFRSAGRRNRGISTGRAEEYGKVPAIAGCAERRIHILNRY